MMKGADKMKEKELLKLGYKKYEGETYDVYFNKDICKHSAIASNPIIRYFN